MGWRMHANRTIGWLHTILFIILSSTEQIIIISNILLFCSNLFFFNTNKPQCWKKWRSLSFYWSWYSHIITVLVINMLKYFYFLHKFFNKITQKFNFSKTIKSQSQKNLVQIQNLIIYFQKSSILAKIQLLNGAFF